jgi:hypothetical protein
LKRLIHVKCHDGLRTRVCVEKLGVEAGHEEAGLTVEESMFAAYRFTVSRSLSFRLEIENQKASVNCRGDGVSDEEVGRLLRDLGIDSH